MRKITSNAINAFMNNDNFSEGNTRVEVIADGSNQKTELYLHDNLIAYKINGNHYISSAGWSTSTTRERLNELLTRLACGRTFVKDSTMWYEDSVGVINLLDSPYFTQVR